MWRDLFLEHPHAVGESYFEHQRRAFGFAGELFVAAVACALHGLVPRAFPATASGKVRALHETLDGRRRAASGAVSAPQAPGAAGQAPS